MPKRGPKISKFVRNCEYSRDQNDDWTFGDAAIAHKAAEREKSIPNKLVGPGLNKQAPPSVDLRTDWWKIRNQGNSGACVGFATADGVLRWQYVQKGMMEKEERPSPRFIWMANKETDDIVRFPTTFIEKAGTSTKLALRVAHKYGCVPDEMLPMSGKLSALKANVFFSIAAQFRITAYYNLRKSESSEPNSDQELLDRWRQWIAFVGPVLTRLDVDKTWKNATDTGGKLASYDQDGKKFGGHAVCLVGYTSQHFIVRNSWGKSWGDKGFAYASNEYALNAFDEAYGAVI